MTDADPYFDDDQRPAASVGFAYPEDENTGPDDARRIRLETIARFLALLCDGARDADSIGRRVRFFQFLVNRVPATQAELAAEFGITEAAVSQSVKRLRSKMRASIDD